MFILILLKIFLEAYTTPFVVGVDFDNSEICPTGTETPNECEGLSKETYNISIYSSAMRLLT